MITEQMQGYGRDNDVDKCLFLNVQFAPLSGDRSKFNIPEKPQEIFSFRQHARRWTVGPKQGEALCSAMRAEITLGR